MADYTVLQISEFAEVTKQTVRRYIEKLKVQHVATHGKTRLYSAADSLRIIKSIKPDISMFIDDDDMLQHVTTGLQHDATELQHVTTELQQGDTSKDEEIKLLKKIIEELEADKKTLQKSVNDWEKRYDDFVAMVSTPSITAASGKVVDGDHVRVPAQEPKRSFLWRLFHR